MEARARLVALAGILCALLLAIPSKLISERCRELCRTRLAVLIGPDLRIGSVEMSPLGIRLESIESDLIAIDRAVVSISPFALLTGRVVIAGIRFDGAIVQSPRLRLRWRSLVLSRAPRGWHGVAHDLSSTAPLTAAIEEVSFDLNGGHPERIAFVGGSIEHPLLGAIRDVQGQLRGVWPQIKGRIAAPALLAEFDANESERKLTLHFTRHTLNLGIGKSLLEQPPELSGTVEIMQSPDGPVQLVLGLKISGLVLRHRLLSAHSVGPIELQLGGDIGIDGDAIASNSLRLRQGGIELELQGRWNRHEARFEMRLPKTACSTLLESVPQGFLSRLASLPLSGDVAGRFAIHGAWDALAESDVAIDLDFQCKTTNEAPLGDPTRLGPLGKAPPEDALDPALRAPRFTPLAMVPATLIRALLESEDSRFFLHHGFDVQMLRRALAYDLVNRRLIRGASTLSQQLVKNLYLSGERTLERKLEEAFLTWRLEATTSKGRILELYLNIVDFGEDQRGIAAATRHYYNRPTSELTLDQSAELVALLPAPDRGRDDKWQERVQQLRARLGLPRQQHP